VTQHALDDCWKGQASSKALRSWSMIGDICMRP